MTVVSKYGGTSLKNLEDMELIANQVNNKFRGKGLAIVVSAQGKTTDRIIDAIAVRLGKKPEPEEVFAEFEGIFPLVKNSELEGHRYAAYESFRQNLTRNLDDPQMVDMLLVTGERLSALLTSNFFREYGIDSQWIDFHDDFPLVVKGGYQSAVVNLSESRKKAERIKELLNTKVLIFPGYGGIDKLRRVKTLGRGGSDTAAFGLLYALTGDELWICTDVSGIKVADVEGAETVPEIDIQEAEDTGFFGAKLAGGRAVEPLRAMFEEGLNPYVWIANSHDIDGKKTRIVRETEASYPVKIIAGRDIATYDISGDGCIELINKLNGSVVDWFSFGSGRRRLRLGIPEKDREIAIRMISEYEKSGRIKVGTHRDDVSIIGAIGSGMEYQAGVAARAESALAREEINTLGRYDPSDVSIGIMIDRRYRDKAINALYGEFFG